MTSPWKCETHPTFKVGCEQCKDISKQSTKALREARKEIRDGADWVPSARAVLADFLKSQGGQARITQADLSEVLGVDHFRLYALREYLRNQGIITEEQQFGRANLLRLVGCEVVSSAQDLLDENRKLLSRMKQLEGEVQTLTGDVEKAKGFIVATADERDQWKAEADRLKALLDALTSGLPINTPRGQVRMPPDKIGRA